MPRQTGDWLLVRAVCVAIGWWLAVAACTLVIGLFGYAYTEGMGLYDAMLNASVTSVGGGRFSQEVTDAGKAFADIYAIASKIAFFLAAGLMPIHVFRQAFGPSGVNAPQTEAKAARQRSLVRSHRSLTYRIAIAACYWLLLSAAGLSAGVAGFSWFEGMRPLDGFANAAMTMFAGGPVNELHMNDSKLFVFSYLIVCKMLLYFSTGMMPIYLCHEPLRDGFERRADNIE